MSDQDYDRLFRELQAIDASVPVLNTRTMQQDIDNHLVQERLVALLSDA